MIRSLVITQVPSKLQPEIDNEIKKVEEAHTIEIVSVSQSESSVQELGSRKEAVTVVILYKIIKW